MAAPSVGILITICFLLSNLTLENDNNCVVIDEQNINILLMTKKLCHAVYLLFSSAKTL